MSKYVIITDSTCDLPQHFVDEYKLDYIPMDVMFGDEVFKQYLDERALKLQDFYARLDRGEMAKTSLINMQTFIDKFEPYLEKGLDVFYLGLSSGLSATWVQANLAREELLEKYKDRKIVLVDTRSASIGEAVTVLEALRKQKEGLSIDELEAHIKALAPTVHAFFVPENLETLKRGGRVSAVKAFIGDALGVKPILRIDEEGKIVTLSKGRGLKNALKTMVDLAAEQIKAPYDGPLYIVHANNPEGAALLQKLFVERFGGYSELLVAPLGPVISAHTGTGAVCVVFTGKNR